MPRKDPAMVWALAKRLASSTNEGTAATTAESNGDSPTEDPTSDQSQAYKLLRIAQEARYFFSRKPTASHLDQLKHSLAMAEYNEQQAVADWRHLPLHNKWAPNALTSRDAYALGPVEFNSHGSGVGAVSKHPHKSRDEAELCPLIRPPQLDRSYLMERLVQRGLVTEASKDTAAALECWLIP